jgi:hypothetical protein
MVDLSKSSLGRFKFDILFQNEINLKITRNTITTLQNKINSPYISGEMKTRMNNICNNMSTGKQIHYIGKKENIPDPQSQSK